MSNMLDIEDIRALLPHRYPMLLVDRVLELEPGKHVVGLKNVTINEPYFVGHFPGQAVMPGVMILESMAQVAGIMMLSRPGQAGRLAFIASIEKSRFRRPVVPGDTLITEAHVVWVRSNMGKVRMEARVGKEVAAECEMTFALRDPVTPEQVQQKLERLRWAGNGGAHGTGERTDARAIRRSETGEVVGQGGRGDGDSD